MKKFIHLGFFAVSLTLNAQVGINTTTPNGATVLDITSTNNDKGILIPRLTTADRDTKLADNNPATIPPAGVINPALTSGTLIFNTTDNRFEFWDGVLWRQLFVATSSQAGNDGVVKINGGSGGTMPTVSNFGVNNSFGNPKQVFYTTPLTFAPSPTTSWPETTPTPVDSDIYLSTGRFRENPINGQVHLWRLIVNITAGASSTGAVMAIIKNATSGFEVNSIQVMPAGSTSGNLLTFYFYTIADPLSLSANQGYELWLDANKAGVNAQIISFTRVSLFKD